MLHLILAAVVVTAAPSPGAIATMTPYAISHPNDRRNVTNPDRVADEANYVADYQRDIARYPIAVREKAFADSECVRLSGAGTHSTRAVEAGAHTLSLYCTDGGGFYIDSPSWWRSL